MSARPVLIAAVCAGLSACVATSAQPRAEIAVTSGVGQGEPSPAPDDAPPDRTTIYYGSMAIEASTTGGMRIGNALAGLQEHMTEQTRRRTSGGERAEARTAQSAWLGLDWRGVSIDAGFTMIMWPAPTSRGGGIGPSYFRLLGRWTRNWSSDIQIGAPAILADPNVATLGTTWRVDGKATWRIGLGVVGLTAPNLFDALPNTTLNMNGGGLPLDPLFGNKQFGATLGGRIAMGPGNWFAVSGHLGLFPGGKHDDTGPLWSVAVGLVTTVWE